jgi:hypothetical protein
MTTTFGAAGVATMLVSLSKRADVLGGHHVAAEVEALYSAMAEFVQGLLDFPVGLNAVLGTNIE